MAFLFVKLNILHMFKKYGFSDCKPKKTLMSLSTCIGTVPSGTDMNATLFQGMICSLLYLIASHPDIMFSTTLCAFYQAGPKESHLHVVKRIFRYLKHTPNLRLWHPYDSEFKFKVYTDSDRGGCDIDHKITLGGSQILGNGLVRWSG